MSRLRLSLLAGVIISCACTSAAPTSSVPPSAPPSDAAGDLPPGCEPIDLRAPNGEAVELDGTWVNVVEGLEMTWWIRTEGTCVWGAGLIPIILTPEEFDVGSHHYVQSLNGHLGADFVISGQILNLSPPNAMQLALQRPYSELRMLVEFDDSGAVVLREDREPGVAGPRCPDPPNYCPDPLVLKRAD